MNTLLAPTNFRARITKSTSPNSPHTWNMTLRQQTSAGPITDTEYRYHDAKAATSDALADAYIHSLPVGEWPITKLSAKAEQQIATYTERIAASMSARLTPEAEKRANDYLAAHPTVVGDIMSLLQFS